MTKARITPMNLHWTARWQDPPQRPEIRDLRLDFRLKGTDMPNQAGFEQYADEILSGALAMLRETADQWYRHGGTA